MDRAVVPVAVLVDLAAARRPARPSKCKCPSSGVRSTKGFGFVAPNEGGKDDEFVHASALQRAGVMQLAEGQTIWMDVVQGAKGPEAASIRVD